MPGSPGRLVPAPGRRITPGQRLPVTDGDRLRFGFHTQLRLLVPSAR
jgi:hypothetical protein